MTYLLASVVFVLGSIGLAFLCLIVTSLIIRRYGSYLLGLVVGASLCATVVLLVASYMINT